MNTEPGQDIKERIKGFISHAVNVANVNENENLFESGMVNSLFAIQLMTFIEKTFDIEVAMDDLDIENFKSVSAAAAFVTRKNRSAAA